jgi:pilus assembly protein CpaB
VGRRAALLIAAVIVAAIGTSLIYLYVKSADDRAMADVTPVKVLVARSKVAAGTPVTDAAANGAFVLQSVPRSAAVSGVVPNIDPIQGKVALTTIFPGQQILRQMFGVGAAATSPFAALPKATMAVSFSFADPNRVAGFVQPGSKVAVFVTGQDKNGDYTRILLPSAQVVAVGPTTVQPATSSGSANKEQVPRALLTLALSQGQAEKMIFAASKGTLYLGLLTDGSQVGPSPGANERNLFASSGGG